jgi:membrane dipeptidase
MDERRAPGVQAARQPIFDGHNDALEALYVPGRMGRDLLVESGSGHIDLPRALRGGFGGGFFALFVPAPVDGGGADGRGDPDDPEALAARLSPIEPDYARQLIAQGMAGLVRLEAGSGGRLAVVRDLPALRAALERGVIAAVMHFEGAEAIQPDLQNLETYHAAGLRSLGLVWSRPNAFGCGVNFRSGGNPDQGPGLTEAGKELVRACNRLGIQIDLSHLNQKGFRDVERISSAPLVATHSCAWSLSPSPRNLTDSQLDAIGASHGLVGINFCVSFLRADNRNDPDTPLSDLVRHFTYVAERIGVEHVAFGSDFDGCTVPREVGDVSGLPRVLEALRLAGFSEDDLAKIAHGNWLRVLDAAWS